jgi:hypothetical protein
VDHPETSDGVDFFNVDLEKGRQILEVCRSVIELRRDANSKYQTWGLLRPLPNMLAVESYARRLESVQDQGEGSALWAEITAQGLHEVPELKDAAAQTLARMKAAA